MTRRYRAGLLVVLLCLAASCATTRGVDDAAPPTPSGIPGVADPVPSSPAPVSGTAFHVVVVPQDDVLNVRAEGSAGSAWVGTLSPDPRRVVLARDPLAWRPDGRSWLEVEEPSGFVNGFFLTPALDALPPGAEDAVAAFADVLRTRGDLRPVVSPRGLFVWHFDDVRRFLPEDLATLATDGTARSWGSPGCSPDECPRRTFMEAIGAPFLGAYDDEDTVVLEDVVREGPNGMVAEAIVPFEFRAFHHLGYYDPGDDPQFDGLDWSAFYVYVEPAPGGEDGARVAAISVDLWGP